MLTYQFNTVSQGEFSCEWSLPGSSVRVEPCGRQDRGVLCKRTVLGKEAKSKEGSGMKGLPSSAGSPGSALLVFVKAWLKLRSRHWRYGGSGVFPLCSSLSPVWSLCMNGFKCRYATTYYFCFYYSWRINYKWIRSGSRFFPLPISFQEHQASSALEYLFFPGFALFESLSF